MLILFLVQLLTKKLQDEIRITVIATGFENTKVKSLDIEEFDVGPFSEEDLDIPAFLRRNKKR